MSFKLPLIFAFTLGISSAFADDDFDLPDDVQKAEVPANAEDITDVPVNFAPIEATTTETTSEAPAKPLPVKNKSAKDIAESYLPPIPEEKKPAQKEKAVHGEKLILKQVQDDDGKQEKSTQGGKPILKQVQNDKRVQVQDDGDKPAAFKAHQIPEDLDRPLRVGIYTGVKELYLKY